MQNRTIVFWCVLVFTLALQAFVLWFDGWNSYSHIDKIIHVSYGLSIFLFFVIFLRWKPLDALLLVLCFQFFWEAGEIFTDTFKLHIVAESSFRNYFFFDGLLDTVSDGLGALAGWAILLLFKRDVEYPKNLRVWMSMFLLLMLPMIAIGSLYAAFRSTSPDMFVFYWIVGATILSIALARVQFFKQLQPH